MLFSLLDAQRLADILRVKLKQQGLLLDIMKLLLLIFSVLLVTWSAWVSIGRVLDHEIGTLISYGENITNSSYSMAICKVGYESLITTKKGLLR